VKFLAMALTLLDPVRAYEDYATLDHPADGGRTVLEFLSW
jgi:hypothetical protein